MKKIDENSKILMAELWVIFFFKYFRFFQFFCSESSKLFWRR